MNINQEPKYKINEYVGRLQNRSTNNFIPNDEPVFVIRAKDKNAVSVLSYYKALCINQQHIDAIDKRIESFVAWASENPEKMKEPDTGR